MRAGRFVLLAMVCAGLLAGCLSSPGGGKGQAPAAAPPPPKAQDLPADADLAKVGRWEAPFDGEVPAINMVLLHDGRILYWSGVEANQTDGATEMTFFTSVPVDAMSRVLDLSKATPTVITPVNPDGSGNDLFCAGQTVLPDGRVLAVGSSQWRTEPTTEPFLRGGADARIFDPSTNTWTRKADMLFGRWYPSAITLPDGRALVASGIGSLTDPTQQWPQIETYDPATDQWTYLQGGDRLLPLYPRITVVPGGPLKGHLFYDTVGTLWGPFGEHPEQAVWSLQQDLDLANTESGWAYDSPSSFGARQHAANVMLMLDPSRQYAPEFLTFGGTLYQSVVATPVTERVDLASGAPINIVEPSMANPRWHHNGVLLPTGEVLAVGGGLYDNVIVHGQPNVPVLPAEQYDPATDTWSTLASMTVPRMYHSTAILLPDGRILAGGHVPLPNPSPTLRDAYNPQITEKRLEIFDPPYLFRGPRPAITAAPEQATFGSTFTVQATGDIDHFVFMRPGATTHAFDSEQRGVLLPSEKNADGSYTVHAPPDSVVLQPGYSMLFAIGKGEGGLVPSVAAFVHLS